MFDLRYHVASLAAVFVALIIGILVGVGISGRGVLGNPERSLLDERIADLQAKLDAADQNAADLKAAQRATAAFSQQAYSAVMAGRLRGRRVAILVVGPAGGSVRDDVQQALDDAGAQLVRFRAVQVPLDAKAIVDDLAATPALQPYARRTRFAALGRALGRELVAGGATPFWDAVRGDLVEEQTGVRRAPADAVVVVRTAKPQQGATAAFLSGLYQGVGDQGAPVVGAEESRTAASAVPVFRRFGLSSVDDVDLPVGKVALATLLAGGRPGHYGLKAGADGGVLPPVAPLAPTAASSAGG